MSIPLAESVIVVNASSAGGEASQVGFYETGQPFVRLFRDGQARSQLWPVSARQDRIRRLCDYVRRVRNHGYLLGVSIMTPYQSMKPASPLTNNFRAFATCSGLPFLIRCFKRAYPCCFWRASRVA